MEEYVFVCEDSLEGIFSGVYEAYEFKKQERVESHDTLHLAVKQPDMQRLFTRYIKLKTVEEKANKVVRTIKRELGEHTYYDLCLAAVCADEEKADAVYHTIVTGLKYMSALCVYRLSSLSMKAFVYV